MEVDELLRKREDLQVIDVREDWEWSAGHIPGAVHIPLDTLAERLENIDRNRPAVTVCRTGPRSERGARTLNEAGFSSDHLSGGVTAWHRSGGPLVDDTGNPGSVAEQAATPADGGLDALQDDFIEIAMALQQRFGSREPSEEEAKAFMREWLERKGTPADEIDRILSE